MSNGSPLRGLRAYHCYPLISLLIGRKHDFLLLEKAIARLISTTFSEGWFRIKNTSSVTWIWFRRFLRWRILHKLSCSDKMSARADRICNDWSGCLWSEVCGMGSKSCHAEAGIDADAFGLRIKLFTHQGRWISSSLSCAFASRREASITRSVIKWSTRPGVEQ